MWPVWCTCHKLKNEFCFTHELAFGFRLFSLHIICGHLYRFQSRPFPTVERSLVAWDRWSPIKGQKHGGVIHAWKSGCIEQAVIKAGTIVCVCVYAYIYIYIYMRIQGSEWLSITAQFVTTHNYWLLLYIVGYRLGVLSSLP